MAKGYFKKIIIYSEEEVPGPEGTSVITKGNFTTIEDISNQKTKLIKRYGYF